VIGAAEPLGGIAAGGGPSDHELKAFAHARERTAPVSKRRVRHCMPVDSDLEKKILALEARRVGAMVRKDIETLDALLADDLSYTHSGGHTDTKAGFLASIKDNKERYRYQGVDFSDAQVMLLSGQAVVVRGRALMRLEGLPGFRVIFLDVWALRDDAWKMVAWQATRIPA